MSLETTVDAGRRARPHHGRRARRRARRVELRAVDRDRARLYDGGARQLLHRPDGPAIHGELGARRAPLDRADHARQPPPDPEAGWSALTRRYPAAAQTEVQLCAPQAGGRARPGADRASTDSSSCIRTGTRRSPRSERRAQAMTASDGRIELPAASSTAPIDLDAVVAPFRELAPTFSTRHRGRQRGSRRRARRAIRPPSDAVTREIPSGPLAGGRVRDLGNRGLTRGWPAPSSSRWRPRWRRSPPAIAAPPPATRPRVAGSTRSSPTVGGSSAASCRSSRRTFPGYEVASHYEAAREVGGDFFDLFRLRRRGRPLSVVIADVTGKGIAAALADGLLATAAPCRDRPHDRIRRRRSSGRTGSSSRSAARRCSSPRCAPASTCAPGTWRSPTPGTSLR